MKSGFYNELLLDRVLQLERAQKSIDGMLPTLHVHTVAQFSRSAIQ